MHLDPTIPYLAAYVRAVLALGFIARSLGQPNRSAGNIAVYKQHIYQPYNAGNAGG